MLTGGHGRGYPLSMRLSALIILACLLLAGTGCAAHSDPPPRPLTAEEKATNDREASASEALAQAMQLFHGDRFLDNEAALDFLDQALALDPELVNARYYRASLLLESGRVDEALADVDRVIETRPDHVQALFARGSILIEQGDYGAASRDFTRVIELEPTRAEAYARRGVCYSSLGRLDEAIDDYSRTLSINPAHLDANFNRGMAHLSRDEYEDALRDLSQAFILDSQNVRIITARAQAYLKLGRFREAADDYRNALLFQPTRSTLYGLLGEALWGAGDMDGAIRAVERALALARSQGDDFMASQYLGQMTEYRDHAYP